MTARHLRVLICEDDGIDAQICLRELERGGFRPDSHVVQTPEDFLGCLEGGQWEIVLSDYTMPRFSAKHALRLLREKRDDIPFIVVTGSIDEETAVDCLKLGADDYVLKENPTRLGPAVHGALAVYEERRKRRQLEEELRQVQKLEAVGRLAAGVAHDFNNLLTVIRGYSGQILELADDERVMRAAERIVGASDRAARLTSRLLSFGREQRAEPAAVDPSALIEGVHELMSRSIGDDIEIVVRTKARRRIWADAGLLEQVLVNLAINAGQAMPRGGRLTLTTEDTDLDDEASASLNIAAGRYVRIGVEDTGCGIPRENLDRIFEPFFTTKAPGEGTGLGLSTSYGIIRQSGGSIRVESELGEGSRFELLLPHSERTTLEGLDPVLPSEGEESDRMRVLVVEDDDAVRGLILEALQQQEIRTSEAAGGEEALRQFGAEIGRFDLVISDMIMPGMSGKEFFREVRAKCPGLPFLFVSGYSGSAQDDLLAEPRVGFLGKPFSLRTLLKAVQDATQRTIPS